MGNLIGIEWEKGKNTKYAEGRQRHATTFWTGNHPLVGLLFTLADAGNMAQEASDRGCIPGQAAEVLDEQLMQMWYMVQQWTSEWIAGRNSVESYEGPDEPSACPVCHNPSDSGSTKCEGNAFYCKECNLGFYSPIGEGL